MANYSSFYFIKVIYLLKIKEEIDIKKTIECTE